ncbi:hypothetical protein GCM10010329_20480 [Streptomyces spiroverticillatus]|uniref:Uncharacterized protein n=1 Tax=Streptomyces finlayi TaxID=67296 RepID=A0A918WUU5_9ACTN|nr:hypothetical protein GCM10010329_20480 [Streptomyces spiroverticillatus]GHC83654.1 hypothetical protein GCM10010334_12920 [Streptomyces finlayi]
MGFGGGLGRRLLEGLGGRFGVRRAGGLGGGCGHGGMRRRLGLRLRLRAADEGEGLVDAVDLVVGVAHAGPA